MSSYAPYTGGSSPGAGLFFVDGDFTIASPEGIPVISYPLKGDSILTFNDIVIFYPSIPVYSTVSLGTIPNIHPWAPNQNAFIVEQEFIVAQNYYQPTPLNTQYNPAWALGFKTTYHNGYPWNIPAYLVEECELQDIGAGLSKFKARFASIPPTRCELEQYSVTFPGLSTNGTVSRPPFTRNVMTRIQYDYYIFDDLDILVTPLFTDGGNRLNTSTGLYPPGLILQPTQWFASNNIQTSYGQYVGNPTDTLNDGAPSDPSSATLPTATLYLEWCTGLGTGNGQPAEIIVEPSTMTRYMGNIWERRTRFTVAI